MTGLEKIKDQILNEANLSAKEMLEKAQKEAEQIISQAEKEVAEQKNQIEHKTKSNVIGYQQRVESSIDLSRKQAILAAKQDVISDILGKSYEKILHLDDAAYFTMIKKMLEKYTQKADGILYFSEKDLNRMPVGFEEVIVKAGATKGGTLTLSKEAKSMDGGFILAYGGIEENCTIKAIFDSQKAQLSDQIHQLLFS